MDTEVAEFTVESDTVSPLIARVYNEDGYLKIITNEDVSFYVSI